MNPQPGQLNSPFDPTTFERSGLVPNSPVEQNNQTVQAEKSKTDVDTSTESREQKVARATADALNVLSGQTEFAAPESNQLAIEKHMQHLGQVNLVLEDFRAQYMSREMNNE